MKQILIGLMLVLSTRAGAKEISVAEAFAGTPDRCEALETAISVVVELDVDVFDADRLQDEGMMYVCGDIPDDEEYFKQLGRVCTAWVSDCRGVK